MGRREKWKEMEVMILVLMLSRVGSSLSRPSNPAFYLNMLVLFC